MIFCEAEHAVARSVATRMIAGETSQPLFSAGTLAAEKLYGFMEDPYASRLLLLASDFAAAIPRAKGGTEPVLDVTREQFFSALQQEITDHHMDLLQQDTIGQITAVRGEIGGTPVPGLFVASVDEARRRVEEHLAHTSPLGRRPRTSVALCGSPFKALYVRATAFMRNCHAESDFHAYALMVNGDGYFSFPTNGRWSTRFVRRGVLCIEPAGGIHAGQTRDVDLFAVINATKPCKPRLGIVSTADLNEVTDKIVTKIHEDAADSAYCYALRPREGVSIPLSVGTYFVYNSVGRCRFAGASVIDLKQNDVFSWNGNTEGGEAPSPRLSGEGAVVLAVCRNPLPM